MKHPICLYQPSHFSATGHCSHIAFALIDFVWYFGFICEKRPDESGNMRLKNSLRYPVIAIIVGLLASQTIAFFQVYLSNLDLKHSLSVLDAHGYFILPGPLVANQLDDILPAFAGGLFFALSIGAGLTVFAFGAAFCWDRFFHRHKAYAVVAVAVWCLPLIAVNLKGIQPFASLYVLIVPVIPIWSALKGRSISRKGERTMDPWVHIAVILLLAALWALQWQPSLFLDIRDRLLLSNRLGVLFNDAYYRYTLFPAQVFKALHQKTLKTCRLDGFQEANKEKAVERQLRQYDYLRITGNDPADLTIVSKGNRLVLHDHDGPVLNLPYDRFIANIYGALLSFSDGSDRQGFFRQMSFYGLLFGFPLLLYIFAYTFFFMVLSRFLSRYYAGFLSAGLCLLAGFLLLVAFQSGKSAPANKAAVREHLASDRWQQQVSALKAAAEYGDDIDFADLYQKLAASSRIPVRYWLARTLAVSKKTGTAEILEALLDDPSANVSCMAFRALGKRGSKTHIAQILGRIEETDHWYIQWYAYRALKALGWKQKPYR